MNRKERVGHRVPYSLPKIKWASNPQYPYCCLAIETFIVTFFSLINKNIDWFMHLLIAIVKGILSTKA